jgi:hypothetical protein
LAYNLYIPSGTYSWNYVELNKTTGNAKPLVHIKPEVYSGQQWITINGVTLFDVSNQLTFTNASIQKSIQQVSIYLNLSNSAIKNLTLGVDLNLSGENVSIQHVLNKIVLSQTFINSTIGNENYSLQSRFNITNSIIHNFQSNITVLQTYTNNTVNTIRNLTTIVNQNITADNASINEVKFIAQQNFTAINSSVKSNFVKLLSSQNFINASVLAMNYNISAFYHFENSTLNHVNASESSYFAVTNSTINSINATIRNTILVGIDNLSTNQTIQYKAEQNILNNLYAGMNTSSGFKLEPETPYQLNGLYYIPEQAIQQNGMLATLNETVQISENLRMYYITSNGALNYLPYQIKDLYTGHFVIVLNLTQQQVIDIETQKSSVQILSNLRVGTSNNLVVGSLTASTLSSTQHNAWWSYISNTPPKAITSLSNFAYDLSWALQSLLVKTVILTAIASLVAVIYYLREIRRQKVEKKIRRDKPL